MRYFLLTLALLLSSTVSLKAYELSAMGGELWATLDVVDDKTINITIEYDDEKFTFNLMSDDAFEEALKAGFDVDLMEAIGNALIEEEEEELAERAEELLEAYQKD